MHPIHSPLLMLHIKLEICAQNQINLQLPTLLETYFITSDVLCTYQKYIFPLISTLVLTHACFMIIGIYLPPFQKIQCFSKIQSHQYIENISIQYNILIIIKNTNVSYLISQIKVLLTLYKLYKHHDSSTINIVIIHILFINTRY